MNELVCASRPVSCSRSCQSGTKSSTCSLNLQQFLLKRYFDHKNADAKIVPSDLIEPQKIYSAAVKGEEQVQMVLPRDSSLNGGTSSMKIV